MEPEFKTKYDQKFTVTETNDENPVKIIRMLVLEDDRIIVSDFGNKTLKLYSDDYKFINSLVLTFPPQGMCYVEKNTIAVAFVSNVEFLKIIGDKFIKLPRDMTFPVKFLNDVTYIGDGEFILSCEDRDRDSNKAMYLEKINEQSKQTNLLKEKDTLTINSFLHSHTNNIVLFGRRDLLRCFNISGVPRWELKIISLRGIVSYKNDLLVVSYRDNAVYKVSRAGDLKKEPIINRVPNPEVICHQKNRKRILISESSSDVVHVYQITEIVH